MLHSALVHLPAHPVLFLSIGCRYFRRDFFRGHLVSYGLRLLWETHQLQDMPPPQPQTLWRKAMLGFQKKK